MVVTEKMLKAIQKEAIYLAGWCADTFNLKNEDKISMILERNAIRSIEMDEYRKVHKDDILKRLFTDVNELYPDLSDADKERVFGNSIQMVIRKGVEEHVLSGGNLNG